MDKKERDEQKAIAYRILAEASNTRQQVYALRLLIEACYDRNPEAPSLKTYAAHFLWANAKGFPADAVRVLQSEFGQPRLPKIQPGYSDWNSHGRREYVTTSV